MVGFCSWTDVFFFFFHIGFDVFFVIGGVFFIKNLYEIIPIHLLSTN